MKPLRTLFALVLSFFLFAPLFSYAQTTTGSIHGKVIDAVTGEEMQSATVILIDANQKKIGRKAKKDGTYEFAAVDPGKYTMRVTYVGYKTFSSKVTIEAGKDVVKDAKLQSDVLGLEEVVVTGEAEHRYKSDAEVAVSSIDAAKETDIKSYEDLSQLIDGKAAGVHVSSGSGNVNGGVRFDVRSGAGLFGSGQPLIFIDGVRIANEEIDASSLTGGQSFSGISDLNPDDIQKIDILKGPAASALYGTSGANGVILITTKKGASSGMLAHGVNYQYKVTSGVNEQAEAYTANNILSYNDANAIFRKGLFTDHQVSLGGGDPYLSYYASFGRRDEDGIMRNNSFERNSVRANFNVTPSDQLSINVNTNYVLNSGTLPQNDNNILGYLGNTVIFGPRSIGGYGAYALTDSAAIEAITTSNDSKRFTGSIEGIYRPLSDISLRASIGYDGQSYRIEQTFLPNHNYPQITGGQRYIFNNSHDGLNLDLSGAYIWNPMDGLMATTTIGSQLYYNSSQNDFTEKQSYLSQFVTNLGAGSKFIVADQATSNSREAGLFLSQDFDYNQTYLLSFGVRNDYASSIVKNAPSIFYPRISGAIRLDKLGILPSDFDLFKVRAAYGQSGKLPGPLDGSPLIWGAGTSGSGNGAVITFIGNPNIKPERIGEFEIGLELEYKNSYGLDLTYFSQNATNSILTLINAPSTGLTASATPVNVGAISGNGFEASLHGQVYRTYDYQLDLNLIWNYAVNKVTSLGVAPPIYEDQNAVVVGQPRGAFYTFAVRQAVFDNKGNFLRDSIEPTRSFIGNPVAPTTGSFSINFKFLHNFTLSVLTDWSIGGTILNVTRSLQAQYLNDPEYNKLINQLGQNANFGLVRDSTIPLLTPGSDAYKTAANRFAQLDFNQQGAIGYFESSDYWRLREISLRYDFSSLLNDVDINKYIKNISFSLGARNLWYIVKKYSGPDPEVNTTGTTSSVYRGRDFLTLQSPRVIYGTLTIGF